MTTCTLLDCPVCSAISDRPILTSLVPSALISRTQDRVLDLALLCVVLAIVIGRARR